MHEAALAQSVGDILEKVSADNKGAQITSVTLKVGKLSGVELQSFIQSLHVVERNSCFSGAQIRIERPEGQAWCMDCAQNVPLARIGDSCPRCGNYHLTPNGGTEFRVSEVQLDDES